MTYLPQLGRSQSGTGRVLTQCPSRAFLSLISMIMLLLDQWREPWKTQLPGSPVPSLAPLSRCERGMWLREQSRAGCNLTHCREGCCPPMGPKRGKAWLLPGRASHVMFCSWHPNASWWIKWEQLPPPATTVAEQPCTRGAVKNLPACKSTAKGPCCEWGYCDSTAVFCRSLA